MAGTEEELVSDSELTQPVCRNDSNIYSITFEKWWFLIQKEPSFSMFCLGQELPFWSRGCPK